MKSVALRAVVACAVGALALGCGGDEGSTGSTSSTSTDTTVGTATTGTSTGAGGDATTSGAGGGSTGTGLGGEGAGAGGGSSTGTGTGTGTGGSGAGGGSSGLESLGALVVLGDSIGDGGGQPPFYYNLLKADLQAKYGNISYQNNADSGSTTGALLGQVNSLPGSLPGPVAVVITSGGNDMKGSLAQILTGTDGPKKQAMADNIDEALDALLAPGRFGSGVVVHVYEGNIYDASDGAGDFGSHNCAFGNGLPAIPSDPYFDAWNGVIADRVAAHAQVLADMHEHFYGHGYSSSPNWYASDCTHPSSIGHDQLRRFFYTKITGEVLP